MSSHAPMSCDLSDCFGGFVKVSEGFFSWSYELFSVICSMLLDHDWGSSELLVVVVGLLLRHSSIHHIYNINSLQFS